jgi:hypothetical protein
MKALYRTITSLAVEETAHFHENPCRPNQTGAKGEIGLPFKTGRSMKGFTAESRQESGCYYFIHLFKAA